MSIRVKRPTPDESFERLFVFTDDSWVFWGRVDGGEVGYLGHPKRIELIEDAMRIEAEELPASPSVTDFYVAWNVGQRLLASGALKEYRVGPRGEPVKEKDGRERVY